MDADRDARPSPGALLSQDELTQLASEVLGASAFPALVLAMPATKIVAASPHALRLLDPAGGKVVGRRLEEFTTDSPDTADDLVAGGHLDGVEVTRMLRRHDGADQPTRMWIRTFDHQPTSRFVLAVLVADDGTHAPLTEDEWSDAPTVVGTADTGLLIERISSDAEALFGQAVPNLIGRSLLTLVGADDVSAFLGGLSEAFASRRGATLTVRLRGASGDAPLHTCEVLVVPLEPSPSCAFVFLPLPAGASAEQRQTDLAGMLFRLGRGAEIARMARGSLTRMPPGAVPGAEKLTTRELQIVALIVDGDRPPAIAAKLYLSQSTVRNHLSSIYTKLGVTSQQDLVNAFRSASSPGREQHHE